MQKKRNAYNLQDSPACIASNLGLVISFTQGMLQAFQRGATRMYMTIFETLWPKQNNPVI